MFQLFSDENMEALQIISKDFISPFGGDPLIRSLSIFIEIRIHMTVLILARIARTQKSDRCSNGSRPASEANLENLL